MIKFQNVSKSFGRIKALNDISFEIEDGEFIFLTGVSGAGKTTILRLILGEFLADSGHIFFNKEDISKIKKSQIPYLRQQIGSVFQDFKVIPERTVAENVEVALAVTGVPQKDWENRVKNILKLVRLDKRAHLFPQQLSGGELQRVSLARALVVNPKLILADEPTGNLDWETAEGIMSLLEQVNKEGKTIIMATHHKGLIKHAKHRVLRLQDGKIFEE